MARPSEKALVSAFSSTHRQEELVRREVTSEDRATWKKWAERKAQSAVDKAMAFQKAARPDEARRWLERAWRLAPKNTTIMFALANEYMGSGSYLQAWSVLQALNKEEAFAASLCVQAALGPLLERWEEARELLQQAFSYYGYAPLGVPVAQKLCQHFSLKGWCAVELTEDGGANIRFEAYAKPLSLLIDGQEMKVAQWRSPLKIPQPLWQKAQMVELLCAGQPLMGCPLQAHRLKACEGFVEVDEEGTLSGWIANRANPDYTPALKFFLMEPEGKGAKGAGKKTLLAYTPSLQQEVDQHGFRQSYRFQVKREDWPDGPLEGVLRIEAEGGYNLAGSPLDIGLEFAARQALSQFLATGKASAALLQKMRRFLPVPVTSLPVASLPITSLPVASFAPREGREASQLLTDGLAPLEEASRDVGEAVALKGEALDLQGAPPTAFLVGEEVEEDNEENREEEPQKRRKRSKAHNAAALTAPSETLRQFSSQSPSQSFSQSSLQSPPIQTIPEAAPEATNEQSVSETTDEVGDESGDRAGEKVRGRRGQPLSQTLSAPSDLVPSGFASSGFAPSGASQALTSKASSSKKVSSLALTSNAVAISHVAAQSDAVAMRTESPASPMAATPTTSQTAGFEPLAVKVKGIVIIVPVYRGRAETQACLESVFASLAPAGPRGRKVVVQVIDDASDDEALRALLANYAEHGHIALHTQPVNRGFPASVNAGLRLWPGYDAVLLNSDTLVSGRWLEVLEKVAYSHANTGTVTPFSNEASIFSYPSVEKENPIPDLSATAQLMEAAFSANGFAACDVPTANGFCMYIRHDCLKQTGLLREDIFAQGYGEENDFCLRASQMGWQHKAAPGVFVAHCGGVSFGQRRMDLMRRNLEILNRLHPGYDQMIAEWKAVDPLRPYRFALDLYRWEKRRHSEVTVHKEKKTATVVILTHDEGGGVERVVKERCRRFAQRQQRVVLLRPTLEGCRLELGASVFRAPPLEGLFPNLIFHLPDDLSFMQAQLQEEQASHAEWHHFLGHHPAIYTLFSHMDLPYDVHMHDYAWFCQRITLVGVHRSYCYEPPVEGCEACIARQGSLLVEPITVRAMLRRSKHVLEKARTVYAPSADVARRLQNHFPFLAPQVEELEDDLPSLTLAQLASLAAPSAQWQKHPFPRKAGVARFCLIGALGIEKGFDILYDLARHAQEKRLPIEFVVVGYTIDDDSLLETGKVFVTGPYQEEEAIGLIQAQQADYAFFPAIWPETWSFTLALAWRAGLKAVSFNLGAPAERITHTGRGKVLPLSLIAYSAQAGDTAAATVKALADHLLAIVAV
ncbi:glycosyltransferase [Entomobacter blattae]|uniref:Glycosyl transferase family 2 n=1 Tax=Entomobacter blattae TaxID=2762277 RepID=A0A7H1NQZ5_9PROT|nr:glycosyltransferase [Entomobacter blattae]QNT78205.1 Glycosyl transferase family 2 [Entomobacter blattae]